MAQYVQTQNSDRRDYTDLYYDGLLEIFVGLGVILAGAMMLSDMAYMAGIYPALMVPVWRSARKSTMRRMGVTGVSASQKANARLMMLLALVAGVLVLVLAVGLTMFMADGRLSMGLEIWLREYALLGMGVLAAGLMSLGGYLLGLPRLYVYAGLALVIFAAGQIAGLAMPVSMLVYGVILFLCGLFILMRFMHKYPQRG